MRSIPPHLYEGDFIPLRTIPGLAHRVITLNSFSKNFLMTGWRVGVAIAEPEILEVMSNINNSLIYTAPSISQRAAIQALAIRQTIREKYVWPLPGPHFLRGGPDGADPPLSLVRPKGTFYLFPALRKPASRRATRSGASGTGHTFWSHPARCSAAPAPDASAHCVRSV
ncbi:MAG: aminotransferase class I/II-fold pyridoxal phosphate-dependent enzyme [Dysosmobacter sp.]